MSSVLGIMATVLYIHVYIHVHVNMYMCTHVYTCIHVHFVHVCLCAVWCRASKAKVLRLEKEARELEKTTESLRQSQAKAVELEKANKKLYGQTHADRKEIIKLREVSSLHSA